MAKRKIKTTTEEKNYSFRYSPMDEAIVPAVSVEGIRDFWAEIRKQGEELRAKKAIIPRNHVWEDEKKPAKKKRG